MRVCRMDHFGAFFVLFGVDSPFDLRDGCSDVLLNISFTGKIHVIYRNTMMVSNDRNLCELFTQMSLNYSFKILFVQHPITFLYNPAALKLNSTLSPDYDLNFVRIGMF